MKRCLLVLSMLIFSAAAFATSKDTVLPAGTTGHWFEGVHAAKQFYNTDATSNVNMVPGYAPDQYNTSKADGGWGGGLFVGYALQRKSNWFPWLGLSVDYQYISPTKFSGDMLVNSLPQAKNFNISYNVQTSDILAIFKVDIYDWHGLRPFVLEGAGVAINSASSYQESPTAGNSARTSPGFGSNSTTTFAYELGLGLDYVVSTHWALSATYAYLNNGVAKTSAGTAYNGAGIAHSVEGLSRTMQGQQVELGARYQF
mgnify:CR=1 FL=1|tara:strand:- start:237878 stop:238648 length:771 start_codon:yes stop_codon:yes gene_type:complete